jgi:epoxyqueuosine reductase
VVSVADEAGCFVYECGISMLESQLKDQARQLGFERCGIAPAVAADGFERMHDWLARGYAGEMSYMERQEEARRHPSSILPDVKSVIMLGMVYSGTTDLSEAAGVASHSGRVARYARGSDYHDVLWRKQNELLAWLKERAPDCDGRGVVDTAPLLERDFARRAGLGWIGKNTMLIDKRLGSYLFLGALLVNIELQPDPAHVASHCGTCTACLDACPTKAFTAPGWLDARRCISYLTIELRSSTPEELRPDMGNWLFGCDVCQEVCPWNGKPRESSFPQRGDLAALDPVALLGLTEDEFRHRFRGTAIMRTKRRGLLRNAAIVLGNLGDPAALPALRQALLDPEPLIREAAQWAIGRIAG